MVVHNCGYGMGGDKFQTYLKVMGIDMDTGECSRVINTYRQSVPRVTGLWDRAGEALDAMLGGQTMSIDVHDVFRVVEGNRITLPSGLHIHYPGLRKVMNEQGRWEYQYLSKGIWVRIYGPKVVENLTQGLARCVVGEQMLRASRKLKVAMTVHDSVVAVARAEAAEEAKAYLTQCMSWVPSWAEGLPLDCEAGVALTYGDC